MYRGTTPTITLKINSNLNLSQIADLWVTFKWGGKEKTFGKEEVSIDAEEKTIVVELTQEDTLEFEATSVKVQMRFLMTDERAYATNIATVQVNDVLKGGVIGGDSES